MRDQTARNARFPATCARCGGRISEPVAFCPHCGAHARFALAGDASHARRGAAAPKRAEPSVRAYESSDFEGDLDPPWSGPPTPLFASPEGDPYGEMRAPAFRGSRQWSLKGGTALILGAFVVIYGSAVLLHRYDRNSPPTIPQDNPSRSVEGSIAATGGNKLAPASPRHDDAVPPDMSIASLPPPVTSTAPPVAPVQTQPPPASQSAGQPAAPTPGDAARLAQPSAPVEAYVPPPTHSRARANDARAPSVQTTASARAQAAPPATQNDAKTGRAGVARALDGVQARLAKNDLRGARATLSSVLASDPRNGYAQSLRDQLVSREQARDAALNAARACVVQSRWNCVWHNAGSALSVDASSTEAKALVDRAIIESGAATA
ncbi:MAG TPA: hypothetical protein VL635_15500, partial [Trinickia sp.]|nr:hypothetical protein [Trinickia sp.]